MTTSTLTRRVSRPAAFAAAAGIALAAATSGAPVVLAQTTTATAPLPSTIDASKTGSITINKMLNPNTTTDPTGNTQTASGTPLSGVTFTIQKITGDVTTPDGFAALAALTPAQAATQLEAGTQQSGVTQNGTLSFANLPLGAYLVTESIPQGSNVTDAAGNPVTGVIPAPSFIVFVPMTNSEDTTQWNYNPVVYPKNTNLTTTKTVTDVNDNVGDTVDYTISTGVPVLTDNRELKQYQVVDRYMASELGNMAVKDVYLVAADGTRTQITDFTVGQPTVLADGRTELPIDFGATALALLNQNPGATVETNLTATLLAIGTGDGEVLNDAALRGQQGDVGSTTGFVPFDTPESEVATYLAKLNINKIGDGGKALPDATFQLYQSDVCSSEALSSLTPLTVNGANQWTTDAAGQIVIDGLHVTDFVNNAPDTQAGYCLVETKAPTNYELLTDPVQVTFTKQEMTGADGIYLAAKTQDVTNVLSTKFKLPSTGGAGVALIIAAGAALIGGGAAYARRNSKKA